MLVFEGVQLVGVRLTWRTTPLVGCGLGRDFISVASVSFLLAWEDTSGARLVDFSGLGLLSSALTLATISSACSPCCTNCFQVQLSATPIWSRSAVCRLWRHVSTNMTWVMPLGHRSAMFWNLSTNTLTGSPFLWFVARRFSMVISESSSKKRVRNSSSRLPQFLLDLLGSFMNHSKAIPLRVLMNKCTKIASFDTTFPVWAWSSIYVGSETLCCWKIVGSELWILEGTG